MSKLSLHVSQWLDPERTYDFIERTHPPVVKVFGDAGLDDTKIREVKTRSPGTTFVGRMYFPNQGIERDELQPVDTVFTYDAAADARGAFGQMHDIMEKTRGLVDVWEGYNEIPIDTANPLTDRERKKASNYNAFTVEMARMMHDAGMRYAAYSFSTGNPVHVELWDLLLDGLRASDYLALHEYIAPNEPWTQFDFSMCNRYRQFYDRLPADARKPILITECGADFLGQQGFKGKLAVPEYLSKMAQYDAELMRDPNVVGATIYCYGINAPQWKTYDIGGDFTRALRDYILATPTPPIETQPVVTPPAAPPVTPTTQPPALLRLVEVFGLATQARDKLQNGDGDGARALLKDTIVPWFYASAPLHSADLANARAHTTARWFCEEAIRQIEAGNNDKARELLDTQVLPWLASPGPRELGILGIPSAAKRRVTGKKRSPKTGLGTLGIVSKPTRSATSKTTAKPKRRSK